MVLCFFVVAVVNVVAVVVAVDVVSVNDSYRILRIKCQC